MKTKVYLLYLLAFLVLWACIPSNPIEENVLIEGIAIVETNNKKIPFIFQHKDGRNASIIDADENGSYDGLVYKDKEHSAIISFNETTYLPTKAETSDGEIILFNYHSDNTRLNLAILRGETIDYFLDIEIDVSILSELTSKSAINKSSKNLTAIEVIKKVSKIISIVAGAIACDASIAATVLSVGVLAPSILLACGSFAVTVSTMIVDASDIAVEKNIYKGAGLLALGVDVISCLKGDVANCITAAVDLTTEIMDNIRGLTNSIPDKNIDAATGIIEIGQTSSTLTLIGELNFGNVELGKTDEFFFTIRNNSDKEVIVSYIDHPEGYFLNWTSGKIPAKGSQLIGVIFSPIKIQEYKGNIVVDNDLDSENNKIAVLGNGVSSSANTISLVGALEFNNIAIGTSESRFFEILNNSLNDEVIISSIEFENVPTQYFKIVNWSSGAIGPGAKQGVEVVFTPNDTINYSGNIKVVNVIDQINNTIPIKANGVSSSANTISLVGALEFNDIAIGTSESRFFEIQNNSLNDEVIVSSIEFEDVPTQYFEIVNWSSGAIVPGAKQGVEVVFTPTDTTNYSGNIKVINDIDQINNTLPISGKGDQITGVMVLIGDLNFGNVNVGETVTRILRIENHGLNDNINVSNIEVPDGYSVSSNTAEILPGAFNEIEISFSPVEEREYDGIISIINDIEQENNSISISGSAINSSEEVDTLKTIELLKKKNWSVYNAVPFINGQAYFECSAPEWVDTSLGCYGIGGIHFEEEGVATSNFVYNVNGNALSFEINVTGEGNYESEVKHTFAGSRVSGEDTFSGVYNKVETFYKYEVVGGPRSIWFERKIENAACILQ